MTSQSLERYFSRTFENSYASLNERTPNFCCSLDFWNKNILRSVETAQLIKDIVTALI